MKSSRQTARKHDHRNEMGNSVDAYKKGLKGIGKEERKVKHRI